MILCFCEKEREVSWYLTVHPKVKNKLRNSWKICSITPSLSITTHDLQSHAGRALHTIPTLDNQANDDGYVLISSLKWTVNELMFAANEGWS